MKFIPKSGCCKSWRPSTLATPWPQVMRRSVFTSQSGLFPLFFIIVKWVTLQNRDIINFLSRTASSHLITGLPHLFFVYILCFKENNLYVNPYWQIRIYTFCMFISVHSAARSSISVMILKMKHLGLRCCKMKNYYWGTQPQTHLTNFHPKTRTIWKQAGASSIYPCSTYG